MDHIGIVGVVKNHVDLSEDHQTLYWFKGGKKKSTKKIFLFVFILFFPLGGCFSFYFFFSFLFFFNGHISLYDLKYEMLLS